MSTQQLKPTPAVVTKSRGMAHWHAPLASELHPPNVESMAPVSHSM